MVFTKQTQNKITKRNEILLFTKQNETKRNFADFIVSRNKRNFAKQVCCFALFRVSRNKKKDAKWKPYFYRKNKSNHFKNNLLFLLRLEINCGYFLMGTFLISLS
jgi:hypothetical protein